MRRLYILLSLLALSAILKGQSNRLWMQRYDGGFVNGGGDTSPLCATDAAGNVYIAGITAVYGLDPLAVSRNITISSYDTHGKRKWVSTYHDADEVVAVKADHNGNIYILAGKDETRLLKYNSHGTLVWEWAYMGGVRNKPLSMEVADNGSVFILANRELAVDSFDIVTAKFSVAGVMEWSRQVVIKGRPGIKAFTGLGPSGELWLAYSYVLNGAVHEDTSGVMVYNTYGEALLYKYLDNRPLRGLKVDKAGYAYILQKTTGEACSISLCKLNRNGEEIWNSCDAGMDVINDNALALDRSGNVVVAGSDHNDKARITFFDSSGTGIWTSSLTIEGASLTRLHSVGFDDANEVKVSGCVAAANGKENYMAAQLSVSGDVMWINQYDSPLKLNDRMTSMSVLPGGKMVVTGESMYSQSKDFITLCYDSKGAEVWMDAVDGTSLSAEAATAQDIDVFTGDIYVTGYGKSNGLGCDMLTLKYKANGALQWIRYFDGPARENDIASDIKTDGEGNIYVAGQTTERTFPRIYGIRVIKYSENGDIIWNVSSPDTGYMTGRPLLALDKENNVYVCAGSSDFRMRIMKYNSSGQMVWDRSYKPANREGIGNAVAIRLDKEGSIYIAASSMPAMGQDEMCVLKFSPAGNLIWMQEYLTQESDRSGAADLEVDSEGSVYISGYTFSKDQLRFVALKYNTNGIEEWTIASSPFKSYLDFSSDITVSKDGDTYLVESVSFDGNDTNSALMSLVSLDEWGHEEWRQELGNTHLSFFGNTLAATNGSLFIAGSCYNDRSNGSSFFTAAVSSEGELEWVDTINCLPIAQRAAIGVHPNGDVYVSGAFDGGNGDQDIALICYRNRSVENENTLATELASNTCQASGNFTFEVDDPGEICIEILDLSGKKVHCINVHSGERIIPVDVSHLLAGSYIIRAVTGNGVITRPLIVMND